MKTLALVTLVSLSTIANAAVSSNNIRLTSNPGSGSVYALTVYQDVQATDPTSISFDYTGSKLICNGLNVDEGSDWYVAAPGSAFSASTIAAGEFDLFAKSDFSGITKNPTDAPVGSMYLAVNTGTGSSATGPNRQYFGWVKLEASGTTLTLADSAITYDSPGIVVGTTTVVPEPSATVALCGSACAVALLFARRKAVSVRSTDSLSH